MFEKNKANNISAQKDNRGSLTKMADYLYPRNICISFKKYINKIRNNIFFTENRT